MDFCKYWKAIIKLIILYLKFLLFLFMGCEVAPYKTESYQTPMAQINYNEELNEIYTSISLENFENMAIPEINVNLKRDFDLSNIVACIENDTIFNFSSNNVLAESECGYYENLISGCMDHNAINYDSFAEIDNNSCVFEGDWKQFKFGKFDIQSNSLPIYVISSTSFQWFQFDITGFKVDSVLSVNSDIPCTINESTVTFNNFNLIEPGTYEVVRVYFDPVSIDYNITLNDIASNGDIIENNQIFHAMFKPESFIPGNYQLNFDYIDNENELFQFNEIFTLDYNFKPKIVNIEMPSEVMLNDSFWTELEFFVTVFDANNNLDQIKYLINTSKLTNDYEPEISEDIFSSDPSWVMDYSNYVTKNTFRYKTNIPLRPVVATNPEDQGKTGEALFRFHVYDLSSSRNSYSNIVKNEVSIMLLKCGDDICSENYENFDSCPEDCNE